MSNREHTLSYCTECLNRKFDINRGIICSLINEIPTFNDKCPDYKEDSEVVLRNAQASDHLEGIYREENLEAETWGLDQFGIKSGTAAGIIIITVSLIWFFTGLNAGLIFYYPPILFLIGLYVLFRGISSKKKKRRRKSTSKDVLDN